MLTRADHQTDRVYLAGEEALLARDLTRLSRQTLFYPVRAIHELTLIEDEDPIAKTVSGQFSFTHQAFTQVCTTLSDGLASLLRDLAGAERQPGTPRDEYSVLAAKRLFNAVLRRRYRTRLATGNILRTGNLIRAVVGSTYQHVSAEEFYTDVQNALKEEGKYRFLRGCLYEHALTLRYVETTPYCSDGKEEHARGWHFANGETGQVAVTSLVCLCRVRDGLSSVWARKAMGNSKIPVDRVKHTRFDNLGFLTSTLDRANVVLPSPERTAELFQQLRKTTLGLGCKRSSDEQRRRNELAYYLARMDHVGSVREARRVVDSAAVHGSADEPQVAPRPADLAQRTVFDLYLALAREATSLAAPSALRLEQKAQGLLSRRHVLPAT